MARREAPFRARRMAAAIGREVAIRLRGEGANAVWLTLRPPGGPEGARGCARVRVSIDGWDAGEITLLEGWREYSFAPPPAVLRAGEVRVRLLVPDDPGREAGRAPGRLAVHDARLLREARHP